jgi:phosphoenolpyruvate carboxykinase (GTP)
MGDYFNHWLKIGSAADPDKLPKIFYVNWFRRGPDRNFLWPGFGENSRVLKWIHERLDGSAKAIDTPIGRLPAPGSLDRKGLDLPSEALDQLLEVDIEAWLKEVPLIKTHFDQFGDRLPKVLSNQLANMEERLRAEKK